MIPVIERWATVGPLLTSLPDKDQPGDPGVVPDDPVVDLEPAARVARMGPGAVSGHRR